MAIHQTVTPVVRRLDVYLERKIGKGGRDVDPCGVSFFFFFTTEFAKPYNLATWQVDPCEGEDK